jgi:hypothetical protein
MRVPGTRRERVPTLARCDPSGCRRMPPAGSRRHEIAQSRMYGLRVVSRQHVQIDAGDAVLPADRARSRPAQLGGE